MNELFQVFLDHIVAYDKSYTPYNVHHQTHPSDDTTFYSRWLACGSCMMHLHLPERVMHQFRFQQGIPRDPFVSSSPTMVHRDVDVMFYDFYNHLVLKET